MAAKEATLNPSLKEMYDIVATALNSFTPEVIGKSYQIAISSLATDGSEQDLHGSKNLKKSHCSCKRLTDAWRDKRNRVLFYLK